MATSLTWYCTYIYIRIVPSVFIIIGLFCPYALWNSYLDIQRIEGGLDVVHEQYISNCFRNLSRVFLAYYNICGQIGDPYWWKDGVHNTKFARWVWKGTYY